MQILSEFPKLTKEDWLAQVSKDLKGAPLESLHWPVSDQVIANPLVDAGDIPAGAYPLAESPNNWEICEKITVNDPAEANAQALEALRAGAEGLCFHWLQTPDSTSFSTVLEGIYLDFIGLHFEGAPVVENPGLFLALLGQVAAQKNIPTTALKGSLNYDPETQSNRTDWRYLAELVNMACGQFPGFKVIRLVEVGGETPEQSLVSVLNRANGYTQKLSEAGVQPSVAAAALEFEVQIGPHYFVEIARLRAFDTVWLNWSAAWDIPLQRPAVTAVFDPNAYSDAIYTNMIKSSTMAMSAALGGAQRILVLPYDEGREHLSEYPKAFARRIARNVQHLLKLESGLHALSDPAAGSYYIENLTHQIAQVTWAKFVS
jgi:methylmalonyl-CoA mutase